MPPRLATSGGPRRPFPPPPLRSVQLTAAELRALAATLAGWAAQAEAEGRHDTARRLAWRSAALGEAARDRGPAHTVLAAEQAVLGLLLRRPLSPSATAIGATLRPDHFADPIHARIYAVARSFAPEGTGMHDLRRIGEALGAELSEVGGAAYLHQLALCAPTTKAAGVAAASVREAWARRELIDLGEQLARLGAEVVAGAFHAGGPDATEQAGYLAARLRGLTARLGTVTGRAAQ